MTAMCLRPFPGAAAVLLQSMRRGNEGVRRRDTMG